MKIFVVWPVICGLIMLVLFGCTTQHGTVDELGINRTLDSLEEAYRQQSPEGITRHYRFPFTYEDPFQTETFSRERWLTDVTEFLDLVEVVLYRFEDRQIALLGQDTARVDTVHRFIEIEDGARNTFALRVALTMERTGGVWFVSRYAWEERLEFETEPA